VTPGGTVQAGDEASRASPGDLHGMSWIVHACAGHCCSQLPIVATCEQPPPAVQSRCV
jgi:hypothetical protein